MEQKYRAEYKFRFIEIDRGAPVLEKKKWLYVEAVKALLDLGVTSFRASFRYIDPRNFTPENDYEYNLRDRLVEQGEVRMQWEFRYNHEDFRIFVENDGNNFTVKRIVLLRETYAGTEKIKDFYTPARNAASHIETLKLEYGENIKIDFR